MFYKADQIASSRTGENVRNRYRVGWFRATSFPQVYESTSIKDVPVILKNDLTLSELTDAAK